ncbi:recombination-associated protein RdgC [Pandoraea faecigallinarum]|uniref:Recombination-associated protein RdgC n=1 Tax=Pandoraea faecigallinarum TaxID=656179 RepID=A0A0H3WMZ4_9BURK|nr:recombination-associated protein RdgC [Pandoraea faecigallinarum]AKM29289.1 recombination-associated protein RdgC [Pandoraea faecigallinarum]
MWFKNLQIHRISPWSLTSQQLEEKLAKFAFSPCASLESESAGWAPVRKESDLALSINGQILLTFRTEKKLLPGKVVNAATRERAAELEVQQGFKPGRKQMREIKEQVIDELLPKAFAIRSDIRVWIDTVNRWLAIDTPSPARADSVRAMLLRTLEFGIQCVELNDAPVAHMTDWLASNEAPGGFSVDQDVELRSNTNEKAAVRYVRHPLDGDDVRQHIQSGKRTTRLAMTWNDRISFVLTDAFVLKRIAPLDILKDAADPTADSEAERFDADFLLMTGELNHLLSDVIVAVGGERVPEKDLISEGV